MLGRGRRGTNNKGTIACKEQTFSLCPCAELMQKEFMNKEKTCLPWLQSCLVCKKSTKINHTSGCVTAPDLGDSLWQENKNPQFLKIDKLVYSHAVNCLISKLTNHKLKVTGFPTTSLCFSTYKGQAGMTNSLKSVFRISHQRSNVAMNRKHSFSRAITAKQVDKTWLWKLRWEERGKYKGVLLQAARWAENVSGGPDFGHYGPSFSAASCHYCFKTAGTVPRQAGENGAAAGNQSQKTVDLLRWLPSACNFM